MLEKILSSSKNQETILFRIARYIEEKHEIGGNLNYWNKEIEELNGQEKQFYKSWLWLNYVDSEGIITPPIPEIEKILTDPYFIELWKLTAEKKDISITEYPNLKLENEAGKILLDWARKNLVL